MKHRLTPEILQSNPEYELLAEVSHDKLREFVVKQIHQEKQILKTYSIYQIILMMLYVFLLTQSLILAFKGDSEPITGMISALIFSFTILIVIHEVLHALAYYLTGARKISFGMVLKKFIFYALADRQVIGPKSFHLVALTPFIAVKTICLFCTFYFYSNQWMYFFLSVMCLHSLFCAGDMAMLAFYRIHREKEIFNFDSKCEGKTYFYNRKII